MSVIVMACGTEQTGSSSSSEAPVFASNSDSIVGGTTTTEFPAVGTLSSTDLGGPFCTATLIGPRTVLTAAHCLDDVDASAFEFLTGPNSDTPTARFKASGGKQHPQWNSAKIENDIALVFLAEDASVDPLPTATALPSDVIGQKLRFVGYGVTNGTSQTGFGLKREVYVTVRELSDTQIKYSDKGKNTCNGDSGGPAFLQVGGRWQIVGVTSFGDRGCTQYGVDTRVDAFDAFISSNLR